MKECDDVVALLWWLHVKEASKIVAEKTIVTDARARKHRLGLSLGRNDVERAIQ